MSDYPIVDAFRDIWDWQRKIEVRLKELEKRMTEAENYIVKGIDDEIKLNKSIFSLQQFALNIAEDTRQLQELVNGKG